MACSVLNPFTLLLKTEPSAHRRARVLFADVFTVFLAAFLEAAFLAGDFLIDDFAAVDFLMAGFLATGFADADFLEAVFLTAFFAGAFFVARCATALPGILVAASEDPSCGGFATASRAAPTADLIDPAISSAMASP